MAENYDLIFGQSASSQYAWSDSDYQNGWQTVGSTPPTAEQFDALQRKSDTKAKDLNDRLSPLETKAEANGRQAATSYTLGAMLTVDGLPNGWLLECIATGTSGTDAITLPDTLIDGLTIIDGSVTWALRKVATYGGLGYRQPSTAYAVGDMRCYESLPYGWYLECTTAGTTSSGGIALPSPIAEKDTVTDGTVTWTIHKIDITQYANELATKANRQLSNLDTANLACHVVVDSYYDSTTGDWWREYDDGWVEQGGKSSATEDPNVGVITLLKPMADTNYWASINFTTTQSAHFTEVGFIKTNSLTTTSLVFTGLGNTSLNPGLYWEVAGMGAQS